MLTENVPVKSEPWRNLETLCLMVCRDMLGHEVSVNARNLQMLHIILLPNLILLRICLYRYKSTAPQVAAKILHIECNLMF